MRGNKSPRNFTVTLEADPTIWGLSSEIQIEIIKEEERHTLLHPALEKILFHMCHKRHFIKLHPNPGSLAWKTFLTLNLCPWLLPTFCLLGLNQTHNLRVVNSPRYFLPYDLTSPVIQSFLTYVAPHTGGLRGGATLSALWAAVWILEWPLALSSPISDHNELFLCYPSLCVT